jgi:hypothetical protein
MFVKNIGASLVIVSATVATQLDDFIIDNTT